MKTSRVLKSTAKIILKTGILVAKVAMKVYGVDDEYEVLKKTITEEISKAKLKEFEKKEKGNY